MRRDQLLYDDERPLPYFVQLARVDGRPLALPAVSQNAVPPALMHLDLRGGQFSRPTSYRLARTFDWLIRAFSVRQREIDEHALMITPMTPQQDEQVTGTRTPYIPDDWPSDLRQRSFFWIPVAYDQPEEQYAWQRR